MDRPLLLMDVDGTLSPLLPNNWHPEPPFVNLWGWVSVHQDLKSWLTSLAESYDLVWATTWEAEANDLLAPNLGLPPLPYVPLDPNRKRSKLWAVQQYVGDRPCAWIDDHISSSSVVWARKRNAQGISTLLVRTRKEAGITQTDVGRLIQAASATFGQGATQ